jgi:hypothetical protein
MLVQVVHIGSSNFRVIRLFLRDVILLGERLQVRARSLPFLDSLTARILFRDSI